MQTLVALYLFIIGACMGSFAGAMAWRLEKGRNIVRERSECEHCHHVLAVKDLIPVVSWVWLRGRCRYCKAPIGWSTFLVEALLGVVFVFSYLFWPYSLGNTQDWALFFLWLLALVGLAILFLYDFRHFLLPDVIMYPLIAIGAGIFILQAVIADLTPIQALGEAFAALLPVTGVYGLLYAISKGKWIGFGDIKLGVFIGLALGWEGALITLLLANLIGTIVILPGMLSGKLKRTDHVPFGPFLIAATLIALLWGTHLTNAYLNLLQV